MVDRGNFSNLMNDLDHVDYRIRSCVPLDGMTPLPVDFQPDCWSVICGRGKKVFNHVGNRRFRALCDQNLEKYAACKSKIEKSVIVMSIVDRIREGSKNGGLVKRDKVSGRWFEVGDSAAREKVGQQLREALNQRDPVRLVNRKQRSMSYRKSQSNPGASTSSVSSDAYSFSSKSGANGCILPNNKQEPIYERLMVFDEANDSSRN